MGNWRLENFMAGTPKTLYSLGPHRPHMDARLRMADTARCSLERSRKPMRLSDAGKKKADEDATSASSTIFADDIPPHTEPHERESYTHYSPSVVLRRQLVTDVTDGRGFHAKRPKLRILYRILRTFRWYRVMWVLIL